MLGFGYAYTRDAHVRIDILYTRFPDRFKLKLEIVGIAFLLTPFLLVVLWYGITVHSNAAKALQEGWVWIIAGL